MLLLHQTGSIKIGEVVRYTVTYTPAVDRILPSPAHLHLKIKNTSAIALRAAFVHGPYTLYAAAYPSNFQPNEKFENARRDGVPEFEPNLKAGGVFQTKLCVPEHVRESAGTAHSMSHEEPSPMSVTWVIEVASQVIFSNSASVHYEILLGRDEKSLSMGFGPIIGGNNGTPGHVSDHQQSHGAKDGHHNAQPKGIYTKAIKLVVDDTASLWNKPTLPSWDGIKGAGGQGQAHNADAPTEQAKESEGEPAEEVDKNKDQKQKKVHLVVLTHGLHSNLGADMLYLKESIDATAKQAKIDARARRHKERQEAKAQYSAKSSADEESMKRDFEEEEEGTDEEDEDEEEVIVRGFSGNAVRTERGIKYLGKRLAKYVLAMTYPDQPFLPVTKTVKHSLATAIVGESKKVDKSGKPAHSHSTIHEEPYRQKKQAYKITSISFIAHSLGGLIQTYAVAYIQKHSPEFFNIIKPINFIALATPFLGLSNENPLYVKFALDFGLVGRTGQDLGLTWRAPTIARGGWSAIMSGIGENTSKRIEGERDPGSKPLLRILPTGPAHQVLRKFRNRTVYSNVVNDGIVPLRTSCLLFLDWQGLGRVEKARRENGLVGTMAGWGWAELTGANSTRPKSQWPDGNNSDAELGDSGTNTPTRRGHGDEVPQPPATATQDDDTGSLRKVKKTRPGSESAKSARSVTDDENEDSPTTTSFGSLSSLFGFLKPSPSKHHHTSPKSAKIYRRSQTINFGEDSGSGSESPSDNKPQRPKATRGDTMFDNVPLSAPPRTSFFESAGDVLAPPLPPVDFLIDPSSRPRTIFHDRVYHPEDIPPPPLKNRSTSILRKSSQSNLSNSALPRHTDSTLSARDYDDTKNTGPQKDQNQVVDGSAMKVEEKIARAYHRDLSWRKVLVRLEPDAHNNMIVRRMFSNAYGWPVVKHLCDTHFSDQAVANTRDEDDAGNERAKASNEGVNTTGDEIKSSERSQFSEDHDGPDANKQANDGSPQKHIRTNSEIREATDKLPPLSIPSSFASSSRESRPSMLDRSDSVQWSERDWADSADDSDSDFEEDSMQSPKSPQNRGWNWTEMVGGRKPRPTTTSELETEDKMIGTDDREVREFLDSGNLPRVSRIANKDVQSVLSGETTAVALEAAGRDDDAKSTSGSGTETGANAGIGVV